MSGTRDRRRWQRGRRGTSMVEFVLVIPLLATVLSLTFFFGWAMRNKQDVTTAARYAAWKRVYEPGPGSDANAINATFFAGQAIGLQIHRGPGPVETLEEAVGHAGSFGSDAGRLAERWMLDEFPRGRWVELEATRPTDQRLWREFTGTIHSRTCRDGVAWRRGQASPARFVREDVTYEVEEILESIDTPGEGLAHELRRIYRGGW
jgi:hypothetical protein